MLDLGFQVQCAPLLTLGLSNLLLRRLALLPTSVLVCCHLNRCGFDTGSTLEHDYITDPI